LSLINSGLLAVLLTSIGNNTPTGSIFSEAIKLLPFLGIALCILWYDAVYRIVVRIRGWEDDLESIENPYFEKIANLPIGFRLFPTRTSVVISGISTRWVEKLMPIIFLIVWIWISDLGLYWYFGLGVLLLLLLVLKWIIDTYYIKSIRTVRLKFEW